LTRRDVAIRDVYRIGIVRSAKTSKRGRAQWAEIRDPEIASIVGWAIKDLRESEFFFPFSADHFRRVLHRTCAKLGLSQEYVPHSLRHGCATMLHLLGWSLEDIMLV